MSDEDTARLDFLFVSANLCHCCGCGLPIMVGERVDIIGTGNSAIGRADEPFADVEVVGMMFNLIHKDCEWTVA